MKTKDLFKISSIPVIFASLCCLGPLVLVMLGLSTASFAASLSETFYGEYKWAFRGVGLLTLLLSFIFYLRTSKNICTLDDIKRRRNEIINWAMIVLIAGILGYLVFLYVVVEFIGILYGIW